MSKTKTAAEEEGSAAFNHALAQLDKSGRLVPTSANARPRPANSFSEDEIRLACALFDKLTRRGDISTLLRHPAYASLARKFLHMRNIVERDDHGAMR